MRHVRTTALAYLSLWLNQIKGRLLSRGGVWHSEMHEHPLLHPRKWRRGLFFNPTCDRHPIHLARVSQLPPQNVYPVSSRFASGATYIFLLLPRGTTQVISMLCSSNLNRGVPSCSSDGLARAPHCPAHPPSPGECSSLREHPLRGLTRTGTRQPGLSFVARSFPIPLVFRFPSLLVKSHRQR